MQLETQIHGKIRLIDLAPIEYIPALVPVEYYLCHTANYQSIMDWTKSKLDSRTDVVGWKKFCKSIDAAFFQEDMYFLKDAVHLDYV